MHGNLLQVMRGILFPASNVVFVAQDDPTKVPPADDPSMNYLVHRLEGPDDMPAHIKAALTAVSLSIPIVDGRLALGTWQGIYLFEHRTAPHRREIVLHASS